MVVIRLSRAGSKKRPFYALVVADRRCRRDGAFIERVGFYNPVARGAETPLLIDLEAIDRWVAQGAQPSETVAKLVKKYREQEAAKKIAAEKKPAKKAEAKPAADAAKKPAKKAEAKPAADAAKKPAKKADAKPAAAKKPAKKAADSDPS